LRKYSVSIALATFNGEKYLSEQLDSILNQSYPIHEIIVSDDCSTDNTMTILKYYERNHPKINILENDKNIGLNKNFERVIKECSGQLIAISDQDNIWKKDKLQLMVNKIKNNTLVYSDSYVFTNDGEKLNRLSEIKKYKFRVNSPKEFYFYNAIFGHAMIFKRKLLDDILPFPVSGINYDGWIAFVASCVGDIEYIDKPLVYYRLHQHNLTHRPPDHLITKSIKKPKWRRRQTYNKRLIERLKVFYGFNNLNNNERIFLGRFISELRSLDNSYYRPKLLFMLLTNHGQLLHRKNWIGGVGKCVSQAIGLRSYQLIESQK